jgi:hypothetical protein
MRARIVAGLLRALGLWLSACGSSTEFLETAPPPSAYHHVAAEDVEVFTVTRPSRPFREAGVIETRRASEFSTDNSADVMATLRRAAGARGCDGVILTGSSDTVVGAMSRNGGYMTTLKGYRATCIVYTRASAPDRGRLAAAESGVHSVWLPGGQKQVSLRISTQSLELNVTGVPAEDASHARVQLRLRRAITSSTAHVGTPPHEACELQLKTNDTIVAAGERRFEADPRSETLEGVVEIPLLQSAAETASSAILVCETKIDLSASTRERLTRFLDAFRSELPALPAEHREPSSSPPAEPVSAQHHLEL